MGGGPRENNYNGRDIEQAAAAVDMTRPSVRKVQFQPLPDEPLVPFQEGIASPFHGVTLTLSAELGKNSIKVRELINLGKGSILKLNRLTDENIVLLANEAPFARGEVVVINDRLGVRITSFVEREEK